MTADPHLTLHQLFSPAFPVGAFAWSHGLETAVQEGRLTDAASAEAWIDAVLGHGAGWSDAILFAHAARGEDPAPLAALALALAPSAERRSETAEQGAAFAATLRAVWSIDLADAPYPVAAGAGVAALGLPRAAALALFLQAMAANLVSAAVRAVPLGQVDGQRITRGLRGRCIALAERAEIATLDDLGGFAPALDIASQRHETLYSRIFRS